MAAVRALPLQASSYFQPGLFDGDLEHFPAAFEPISDPALAKQHLAELTASLSSSATHRPESYFDYTSSPAFFFEEPSPQSPVMTPWDPLQQQQQAAFAAMLQRQPLPGLSPPGSNASSHTTSPPSTPKAGAVLFNPFESPTRLGALRSPSSNGARYSPIHGSTGRRRAPSMAAHDELGSPRMRRATLTSQSTPKTAAAAANACIPEPRPRLAPPPPLVSPSLTQGPVDLSDALTALELLDVFMQQRLQVEQDGASAGVQLVTHENFRAIEQLRGRVAASLQMEKLRKEHPRARAASVVGSAMAAADTPMSTTPTPSEAAW